jgi:hypothetical protein
VIQRGGERGEIAARGIGSRTERISTWGNFSVWSLKLTVAKLTGGPVGAGTPGEAESESSADDQAMSVSVANA